MKRSRAAAIDDGVGRFQVEGPYFGLKVDEIRGPNMSETERDQRILRMLPECKVSTAPALLLAAACAALVAVVALRAFLG